MTLPIIHEIDTLYKELYLTRGKIPKPDRFSIWSNIESIALKCLELAIEAALTAKDKKLILIQELKTKIEVGKRLTRLTWELKIINDQKYLLFEQSLAQISKMATGWIKYLTK